ncbi:MAG: DegV family protein [Steroidobacteraceae bacterium]
MSAAEGTIAAAGPAELAELDGLRLADALRAGIYRLFEQTDHINKINVFPVPDGDTGTNMSMTLSAVLAALDRERIAHAGTVLVRIADAALDGARGNSGAILAQFMLGAGDKAGHLAHLTVADFAQAVANGAAYARDALTQPREGTILTVLREFACEVERHAAGAVGDFRTLFARSMQRVHDTLDATRGQLEELRAANVVDAGALGFVDVLEGVQRYLETGEVGTAVAPIHRGEESMAAGLAGAAGTQRYCTECLITAGSAALDLRHLREDLSALGASLVVSGSQRKARVHIHTDDPESVFRLAAQDGDVSAQKADDMHRQQSAAHHRKDQRVAVVTDSAADIPDELIEELGIHVVPVRIHFGTHSYLDKVTMSPQEFYAELARNPEHPKTSQPPPGDFRRMYEFLASHYEAVVSIELTSMASGTYNAAVSAAGRVSTEGRPVIVVDSLNASLGLGLIVIAAAERARQGASANEVADAARQAISRTSTFALLATVDWAVRGGRVPRFVKTVAELLNLSVILAAHPNGRVGLGGVLWGKRRLRERFARWVCRHRPAAPGSGSWRLLVGHANAPAEAHELSVEVEAGMPPGVLQFNLVTDMGPALGVHGGPGTLIVGLQALASARNGRPRLGSETSEPPPEPSRS